MNNRPLSSKIRQYIETYLLLERRSTVLVGLSGGPDSVALLHILNELKDDYELTLIAVHIDHGWRPESEKEAEFCRTLCDELGVRVCVRKLSDGVPGVKFNGSKEEYARKIRRQFFMELAQQYGASAIALGHHADDQKETFFIRLVRGASLSGLVGMRSKHGLYIRPLLAVSKQEIFSYLAERSIPYVTDQSNESDAYLRNRIRNQLLPAFKAVDPRAYDNLEHALHQLQQIDAYLTEHTEHLWQRVAIHENDLWRVDIKQLFEMPISMRHRLYVHWLILAGVSFVPTQRFLAEIEKFLRTKKGTAQHRLHETWAVYKKRDKAYIITNKIIHD